MIKRVAITAAQPFDISVTRKAAQPSRTLEGALITEI